MAGVRIENLGKTYRDHVVFSGLDLNITDGECFTLLGPSGCGKTVILRLIAGFETPTSGDIYLGDAMVSSATQRVHVPTELRRIGVVFQDYAVWPHKTVFENVIYPLTLKRISKDDAISRTRRVIDLVNLRGLEQRLPYQLSGGKQQRVALARALVADPELMILDEPMTNLDANLREEMRFEIKNLQRSTGVTILYVTHDQEIALAISDRMAVMDHTGTVRQIGKPIELFEQPSDGFVFRFMGISNFMALDNVDGKFCLKGAEPVHCLAAPDHVAHFRSPIVGCRPADIELTRDLSAVRGTVKRSNFLGAVIDYRIDMEGTEVRVQQETREALEKNLLFDEGDTCGLIFHTLQWFESEALQEAIQK